MQAGFRQSPRQRHRSSDDTKIHCVYPNASEYRNGMKLALDADPRVNLFRAYSPEGVIVGERLISSNCIITARAVIEHWTTVRTAPALTQDDLNPFLELTPDVVLLGTR